MLDINKLLGRRTFGFQVLPTGIRPMTFHTPVNSFITKVFPYYRYSVHGITRNKKKIDSQMLYHCATGDSWEIGHIIRFKAP